MAVIKADDLTSGKPAERQPSVLNVQAAVRHFLQESLPEARRAQVTRVVQSDGGEGGWLAEAEVWQPNPAIEALGLQTRHPVFDQNVYVVRLDCQLNVVGYEIKEAG
jgi:hypothetical protein